VVNEKTRALARAFEGGTFQLTGKS
jgi:hypothetical protein